MCRKKSKFSARILFIDSETQAKFLYLLGLRPSNTSNLPSISLRITCISHKYAGNTPKYRQILLICKQIQVICQYFGRYLRKNTQILRFLRPFGAKYLQICKFLVGEIYIFRPAAGCCAYFSPFGAVTCMKSLSFSPCGAHLIWK